MPDPFTRVDYKTYKIDPATIGKHLRAFKTALQTGDNGIIYSAWDELREIIAPDPGGNHRIIERSELSDDLKDKLQDIREMGLENPSRFIERKRRVLALLNSIADVNAELIKHNELPVTRDQVFISYSHKDERWREDLETSLKPYVRNGSITSWSDRQIKAGSEWFNEIKAAVARTRVAVMLVTPHFLASDFIHKHELGEFLRLAQSEGVKLLWIPVRASAYEETALKDYNSLIPPNRPLAEMKAERDGQWIKSVRQLGMH